LNEKYAFHLPLIFALFLEKGWIWRCLWEIVAFAVTVFESITGKGGFLYKKPNSKNKKFYIFIHRSIEIYARGDGRSCALAPR